MTVDVMNVIIPELDSYESFAQNFARSRFIVNASEFDTNEKEAAELQKISENIRCTINNDGNSVSLSIYYDDDSEYLNVIQNGMDAPLTGGNDGMAMNPDGTYYHSNVPEQLWGNPINEYAKTGEDVKGEVREMLQDLFIQRVKEVVFENRNEITKQAKTYIEQEIKSALR